MIYGEYLQGRMDLKKDGSVAKAYKALHFRTVKDAREYKKSHPDKSIDIIFDKEFPMLFISGPAKKVDAYEKKQIEYRVKKYSK